MAITSMTRTGHASRAAAELWEYRLLFAICFVFFLLAAVVGLFLPRSAGAAPRGSIVKQARETAGTIAPYAFRG